MLPQEFLQRMKTLLGKPEFDAFLASYDRPRNVGLRRNPLKTEKSISLPFGLTPVPWAKNGYYYDPAARPGLHPYHEAGLYYLQEPSAMAPAELLDAQPGERVLDLCAAPGGKSTQIAAQLCGRGLLCCNEIHPARAKILSRNIERLGIANALVLNETPQRLAARMPEFFDSVLVDAPCSGEGMFRKEEAAIADWSEETVALCAARQLTILDSAAQLLAPGGRLVYSTCTFSPQENEGVVSEFLRAHPDFSVETVSAPYFSPGRPDWLDAPYGALSETFRLFPHKLRGEGHYAAVLRREGAGRAVLPLQAPDRLPPELSQFCASLGIAVPAGIPVFFGETLYLAPEETPQLRGLRVLRAGLETGTLRKGRFEPAHALALFLKTAASRVDFPADSREIAAYLRGESLPGETVGWTLLTVDGLSLGWVKGSNGQLKNHFPKGLRRA